MRVDYCRFCNFIFKFHEKDRDGMLVGSDYVANVLIVMGWIEDILIKEQFVFAFYMFEAIGCIELDVPDYFFWNTNLLMR